MRKLSNAPTAQTYSLSVTNDNTPEQKSTGNVARKSRIDRACRIIQGGLLVRLDIGLGRSESGHKLYSQPHSGQAPTAGKPVRSYSQLAQYAASSPSIARIVSPLPAHAK